MSKLTDQISYLKGMAEGMKLDPEQGANRLILGMLDAMGELAMANEALSEYVESIDEDLADLEDDIYDDGDEEEEDGEFGAALTYECPHCHEEIELDPDELDLAEDHPCPNCGEELFPELPEE